MKQPLLSLLFLLGMCGIARAQDKWDLRRCVEYAIVNNISVKQADLQVRFAELNYRQNKGLQYPTLNWGLNSGYNFGLSENPTTGILQNQKTFSTTSGLQSGVTLFNWFSIKNDIEATRLTIEAEKAQTAKVQNDIALNVAVAYLQILLTKEQVNINAVQVQQDLSQLELTQKKVTAGTLPELNAAEIEAQLATDSSSLISSQALYQQYVLQMKALLYLDAALPFDVTTPPIELIPVENLADLQPEKVYELAIQNLPQQRVNELRIQSANKTAEAVKGQMFPTISAFGNLNSRFVVYKLPVYEQLLNGYQTTSLRVDAGGGNFYYVQSPIFNKGAATGDYIKSDPLSSQLSNNFGQGIGVGIQVPIFNGHRAKINYERARLSVKQYELQNDQDKQTLKQDIYKAFNDAMAAVEKFNASRKAVAAAEKAFDFAQKRYNANLLSSYDLLNNQNRVARARIDMLSAQFEYVFRLKLLEFYKGQGLRL
ncbi:MAG: TolC family protein [Flavisolibacter sp.]